LHDHSPSSAADGILPHHPLADDANRNSDLIIAPAVAGEMRGVPSFVGLSASHEAVLFLPFEQILSACSVEAGRSFVRHAFFEEMHQ
jgi:hypothetical protein